MNFSYIFLQFGVIYMLSVIRGQLRLPNAAIFHFGR